MNTIPRYAVIDTESSGLFDFSKPADAEGQPRMASLAIAILVPHNEGFLTESVSEYLIKPEGWEMQPAATAVNGLTTEYLREKGVDVKLALTHYSDLIKTGHVIAAYNSQFDLKVMRGELRRAGMPDLFEMTPNICLMRACTNVCRVPKKAGSGYKFPKLAEACALFKIEQAGAHSAMGDTLAAVEILRHLRKANLLPEPAVHFAKETPAK